MVRLAKGRLTRTYALDYIACPPRYPATASYPPCPGSAQPPTRVEREGRAFPEGLCGECDEWISLVDEAVLPPHLQLPPLRLFD